MRKLGFALLVPLLVGCTTVPEDAGFAEVARLTQEREGTTARWYKGAADSETDGVVRELLARELDVNAAIQVALLRQPRLQALYEELEVSRADLLQATLPSNPEIELGVRVGVPSLTGVEFDTSIVEDVMSLLFIPLRAKLAGTQLEVAKLRVADAVLAEVAEVKAAYTRHIAARELLTNVTTFAVAAEAAAELAERQLSAGTENELFLRTQIAEAMQARLRVAEQEVLVTETREALLRAMGLFGKEVAIKLPDRLAPLPLADVDTADLEAHAVASRLDIAAGEVAIDVASQELSLAQPWWIPLSAGVELEGEDELSVGPRVGLSVPILDWGQARRMGVEASKRAAEKRLEALAIDVRSRVREASARMVAARARTEFIVRSLLPARRAQLEQSVLQYNRMMIGVYDLLRARQAELEAEQEEVRAREAYWSARAELERAVGGRLPAVTAAPSSPQTTAAPPGRAPTQPTPTPTPSAPHEGHN